VAVSGSVSKIYLQNLDELARLAASRPTLPPALAGRGAESCVDFADFARDGEALFREFLDLPGGLPSHDTFSRDLRVIDPAAFATCRESFLLGQMR
jgi:DDE_Tnp_1-associated